MKALFGSVYKGCRVLLTGHTGFKGSWLARWLTRLDADVTGYSLEAAADPAHARMLPQVKHEAIADVRDAQRLHAVFSTRQPEIVFHLAAQALVRASHQAPCDTFDVNVNGTARVLDACRGSSSVRAVVIVTSDKCYENQGLSRGYRETDPLGGHDPYSASKACAEIVAGSYRRSFFHAEGHKALIATARAGNVIGGGDWAADRLVPDLMRAASHDQEVLLRCPAAVRPWQHVLEPLSGYLLLGQRLLEGGRAAACAWNFGPDPDDAVTVEDAARRIAAMWPRARWRIDPKAPAVHEAALLRLDSTQAHARLAWRPTWPLEVGLRKTIEWYQAWYERGELLTDAQIDEYVASARSGQRTWS